MIPETHDQASKVTAAEIAEHVASIREIPHTELPDAEARAELVRMADTGAEVYAYRPACSLTYVLWVRPTHAWQDGRWEPMEWARCWRAAQSAKDGDA